jgi:hypothetical protein
MLVYAVWYLYRRSILCGDSAACAQRCSSSLLSLLYTHHFKASSSKGARGSGEGDDITVEGGKRRSRRRGEGDGRGGRRRSGEGDGRGGRRRSGEGDGIGVEVGGVDEEGTSVDTGGRRCVK